MERIADIKSLTIERAGIRILEDLEMSISAGETVGVAGPNGSGKTTLLRAIATLIPTTEGSVTLFGGADQTEARRRIGLIGHRPYLVPQLSLAENLHHIGRLADLEPERIDHAIDVVGLAGARDRRAEAASFGMLRRIEIAQQLVARPDLLLLDEALSGLDDSAQHLVSELIRLTVQRQGAVVMVSHDGAHLTTTCDRVERLVDGRMKAGQ